MNAIASFVLRLCCLALVLASAPASAVRSAPAEAPLPLRTTVIAKGLEHPWSLAFLPGGRMLVTERPGRLRIVEREGKLSKPISGLPPVVASGQGGLLDVALHPGFKDNRLVYWSYSEPSSDGNTNGTAVARGRLDADALALRDVQVIFRQMPKVDSSAHFGSRLVFDRSGKLFVTLGERFVRRYDAQNLANTLGKIVRIEDDGGVPADNPFVGKPGADPRVWSYGHRNVQGAALHPTTGALWENEDGPMGGDELNLIIKGGNYGWPVITYGHEYITGAVLGEGETRADVVPPLLWWRPSIAPSGMAFVTGTRYPGWRGQLLIGALKAQQLVRLELDGNKVVAEHRHQVGRRVRDVRESPDGYLYLLTDEDDGELLRIEPSP